MDYLKAHRNRARVATSENYRQQSDLIVQCARKCFETKGVRKTTLVEIAREANMTRELIYYYFSGKQEIVEKVIDAYTLDAVDTASLWCDTWNDPAIGEDVPLPREALVDAISEIRRFVFQGDGVKRPMFAVLDETGNRQGIFSRMCAEIIRKLSSHPTARRLSLCFTLQNDEDAKLLFKFMVLGIIAIIDAGDAQNDQNLADLLYPRQSYAADTVKAEPSVAIAS